MRRKLRNIIEWGAIIIGMIVALYMAVLIADAVNGNHP
jgi:hypothetical protein